MSAISVIIPAHNEEFELAATLQSIKSQTVAPLEIIVVCDSCTDKTASIARNYGAHSYDVSFKRVSKVRNYGAAKAHGTIFVFNDADSVMAPNYLESILVAINSGAEYGIAPFKPNTFTHSLINTGARWRKVVCGNCYVTANAFKDVNGYNENLVRGEDCVFGESLREKHTFVYLDNSYTIPKIRPSKIDNKPAPSNFIIRTIVHYVKRKFGYNT